MEGQNSDDQHLNDNPPNRLAGWGDVHYKFLFTEHSYIVPCVAIGTDKKLTRTFERPQNYKMRSTKHLHKRSRIIT